MADNPLHHMARPCASCPWRLDSSSTDSPQFDMDFAEKLAATCPDHRGMGPEIGAGIFACHQSRVGAEFACAGWLSTVGHKHPQVRLAVFKGRLDPGALEPGLDWPALHENYQQVMEKLRATQPDQATRKRVAGAICSACGEQPMQQGDAAGNEYRWQDYLNVADAVLAELKVAEGGEPGRSAVPHLARVISRACDDSHENARLYEKAAGDAVRAAIRI